MMMMMMNGETTAIVALFCDSVDRL